MTRYYSICAMEMTLCPMMKGLSSFVHSAQEEAALSLADLAKDAIRSRRIDGQRPFSG